MKKNMGNLDRLMRTLVAVIIGVLYFMGVIPGILGIFLFALAIVFLLTSLMSFCPLYTLFGLNTCKVSKD